ncbi:MAG TPA: hypothetical protein VL899_02565 [Alphaproteobacteria bacterium]|jgi:hypothetical protein|nr:hypothetical protein [Alphaproteobacteria bacterium]
MKMRFAATAALCLFAGAAHAQTAAGGDVALKCSDYIAAEKEAGTYGVSSGDKDADAFEKKVVDYCLANPNASATEFITKIMTK